jgi:hypothetical protein
VGTSPNSNGSGRNSEVGSAGESTVLPVKKKPSARERIRASLAEVRKQEKVLVICTSTAVLMSGHGYVWR